MQTSSRALALARLVASPARLAFALVLVIHGALILLMGVKITPDSAAYSGWADILLAHHFNYAAFGREATSTFPPLLYSGFVSLVAVCKLLAGERWATVLVLLNLLADALTAALLVDAVCALTRRRLAWMGALGLYLVSFEILDWTRCALSDITFLLLSFAIFHLAARGLWTNERPRFQVATLLLLGAAVFYRPTGIVLVAPIVATLFMAAGWRHLESSVSAAPSPEEPSTDTRRRARFGLPAVVLGVCAVLTTVIFVVHGALAQNPERWPLAFLKSTLRYNHAHYALGEIVYDRRETWHAPPVSLLDYAAVSADRFAHYFCFASRSFSRSHNALAALFFVPIYALAALGVRELLRRSTRIPSLLDPCGKVVLSSLLVVWSFAVFHALIQVDFDWRYRLPIVPHLDLLAAVGLAHLDSMRAARQKRLQAPA